MMLNCKSNNTLCKIARCVKRYTRCEIATSIKITLCLIQSSFILSPCGKFYTWLNFSTQPMVMVMTNIMVTFHCSWASLAASWTIKDAFGQLTLFANSSCCLLLQLLEWCHLYLLQIWILMMTFPPRPLRLQHCQTICWEILMLITRSPTG